MAGMQPEQGQEKESHVPPSSSGSVHPDASNSSDANPPSTPLSTIPALALDKTPPAATRCNNLLSWFRHPLATFTASLKRRRCASSGDNSTAGRKKKAQILGDACAEDEAAEAKTLQEKKKAPDSDPELLAESIPKAIGATTTAHSIVDCLNDDVYVKKEDMAITDKEEKAKAKEQQGSPKNVVEKKWVGEPIDITECNNLKVTIMSSSKLPESALITNEEAAAAHPGGLGLCCSEMNQQLAAGVQDATENAEAAAPATEDIAVTAVSGIHPGN